jgi:hypothetical protein
MTFSLKPSVNWLFVFVPLSVALEYAEVPAPVLFFSAALAIIPVARLSVLATEQFATYTGDAIGGPLNATFGNAPELIIGLVALRAGNFDMVDDRKHEPGLPGRVDGTPAIGQPGAGCPEHRTAQIRGHYDPSGSIVERMFGGCSAAEACGAGLAAGTDANGQTSGHGCH